MSWSQTMNEWETIIIIIIIIIITVYWLGPRVQEGSLRPLTPDHAALNCKTKHKKYIH